MKFMGHSVVHGRTTSRTGACWPLVAAAVAIGSLAVGSSAAAGAAGAGRFDRRAWLVEKGKQLWLSGVTPECANGVRISLQVVVTQHGRRAAGSVPARTCYGGTEPWEAQLAGAAILRPGTAAGAAMATITTRGRSQTVRWKGRLTIGKSRTPVGDHPEVGHLEFDVGAGVRVLIEAQGPHSNCTRDETTTSFTTQGNGERHDFGFVARTAGICNFEPSWSDYKVVMDSAVAGYIWLGQFQSGSWYFADCRAGSAADHESGRPFYEWTNPPPWNFRCTGRDPLKITR